MTLAHLNALDHDAFVRALGWIFEEAPWVASRAHALQPFASIGELHSTMQAVVERASPDEQLALLRAHPDLGARLTMSEASVREQAGAGFSTLAPETLDRLRQLNAQYRTRFGFPFLFAVKGAAPDDVLAALEARVGRSPGIEFAEALQQVYRIARFRLDDAIDQRGG